MAVKVKETKFAGERVGCVPVISQVEIGHGVSAETKEHMCILVLFDRGERHTFALPAEVAANISSCINSLLPDIREGITTRQ